MIVCVPVTREAGLESTVAGHFGSTPLFMVVDTASGATRMIENANLDHAHGTCQPLRSLAGIPLEAVLVSGIGGGALQKLEAAGVRVYRTDMRTAGAAIAALEAGILAEVTRADACAHHGDGHHDHAHGGANGHGAPVAGPGAADGRL